MVFRETRGHTTSNLITTEGLMSWSSEVFRILSSHFPIWKSCKDRKLKEVLCVIFRSLKKTRKSVCASFTTVCNSSLTHTTYKPSHHNHSIIPLSNHHTIIIPKSHNLRNIYIYNVCVFFRATKNEWREECDIWCLLCVVEWNKFFFCLQKGRKQKQKNTHTRLFFLFFFFTREPLFEFFFSNIKRRCPSNAPNFSHEVYIF